MTNTRDKQMKLTQELIDICAELNWVVGMPKEATTTGLIIGNMEYVQTNCDKVYGKGNYEIMDSNPKESFEELATSDNIDDFQIVELNEEELEEFLESGELPATARVLKPDPTLH